MLEIKEKSILEMSDAEVRIERWKLEEAGLLEDCTFYLRNLLESIKKDRRL